MARKGRKLVISKRKITKKEKKKRLNRAVIIIAVAVALGFCATALIWGRKHIAAPDIDTNEGIVHAAGTDSAEGDSTKPETGPVTPEQPEGTEEIEQFYTEIAEGADTELHELSHLEPADTMEGKNLMVIIDDVGYNLQELYPFLKVSGPLVFAILPEVPFSNKAAELITQAGYQYIIHQPMEAMSDQNLGQNPVTSDMDDGEIVRTIERSIVDLPDALGMNNHMGSKITANQEQMELIMRTLSLHDMIFIDSLTISDSGVKKAAAKLQLPYFRREIFLDNTQTEEYYSNAFYKGMGKGNKMNLVIMIGHVWADGLAETLSKLYAEAEEQGYTFISVGDLPKGNMSYAGTGN